ncbi:hypothetical protein MMC30_000119 [Trapelia coarctata]|nr:hypothetical protein [Trapelia coarctata]
MSNTPTTIELINLTQAALQKSIKTTQAIVDELDADINDMVKTLVDENLKGRTVEGGLFKEVLDALKETEKERETLRGFLGEMERLVEMGEALVGEEQGEGKKEGGEGR